MKVYTLCRNNNNILVAFLFCLLFILFTSCTVVSPPMEGFVEQAVETRGIDESNSGLQISYTNQKGESQIEFLDNKPTMIIFWTDYCYTCKKELPKVNASIEVYEKKFNDFDLPHGDIETTNNFFLEI